MNIFEEWNFSHHLVNEICSNSRTLLIGRIFGNLYEYIIRKKTTTTHKSLIFFTCHTPTLIINIRLENIDKYFDKNSLNIVIEEKSRQQKNGKIYGELLVCCKI